MYDVINNYDFIMLLALTIERSPTESDVLVTNDTVFGSFINRISTRTAMQGDVGINEFHEL